MTTLLEKLGLLEDAFIEASIPHAFGGALALAFCVNEPRATVDIDVNVFLPVDDAARLLQVLPSDVEWSDDDKNLLVRDGQVRLWWEATPIDVFMNTSSFHEGIAERSRLEDVGGRSFPFLGCQDLAVFKAFFDRRRDWADLEAMLVAESFDLDRVIGILARYLGADDERIAHLIEVSRTLPDPDAPPPRFEIPPRDRRPRLLSFRTHRATLDRLIWPQRDTWLKPRRTDSSES